MQRNAGFSLLELLTVVAIVAALASLAGPSYQKFAFKAKTSKMIEHSDIFKGMILRSYYKNGRLPRNGNEIGLNSGTVLTINEPGPYSDRVYIWFVSPSKIVYALRAAPNEFPNWGTAWNGGYWIWFSIRSDATGGFQYTCGSYDGQAMGAINPIYRTEICQDESIESF